VLKLAQGEIEGAVADFDAAGRLSPLDVAALMNRANAR